MEDVDVGSLSSRSDIVRISIDDELVMAVSGNQAEKAIQLLEEGANPNHRDSYGNTPLIHAAKCQNKSMIDHLLNNGAMLSINWTNCDKQTALLVASTKGHLECVQSLLSANALVDYQDARGSTALMIAAKCVELGVLEALLSTGQCAVDLQNKSGNTALHNAAKRGCLANLALLCFHKADINALDRWKNTPLMYAALHGYTHIGAFLIHAQCDVNALNRGVRSALHIAAQHGHTKICELLLEAGAWPDNGDDTGTTPLLLAGRYQHEAIINRLLPLGCDLKRRDKYGKAIIHYCAWGGFNEALSYLLTAGVHPDMTDSSENTALVYAVRRDLVATVKLLLQWNADVRLPRGGDDICSVLTIPLRNGCFEMVHVLVEAGCNTVFVRAAIDNNVIAESLLEDRDIVNWLYRISSNPRSLKSLCCFTIRQHSRPTITRDIEAMHIPTKMKQDILLITGDDFRAAFFNES